MGNDMLPGVPHVAKELIKIKLRDYRKKLIDYIRLSLRKGNKSVIAVWGCCGGKSVIQAEIARSATAKGNRVLFLVHRKELCGQIKNTFENQDVDMLLDRIIFADMEIIFIGNGGYFYV